MKPKVQACLGQLIVSCQAYEDTPLYGAETMKKMVQSAMLGGAQAVRCCWPQDIRAARSLSEKLIIIGINKVMPKGEKKLDDVFITPTFEKAREVVEAGADILKVFPGDVYGPKIIKAIRGPIPYAKMMPTGGVDVDNAADWIKAGAVAVGAGSSLTAGAKTGDYKKITDTARKFIENIKAAREGK